VLRCAEVSERSSFRRAMVSLTDEGANRYAAS
jgi:hypothetical protein